MRRGKLKGNQKMISILSITYINFKITLKFVTKRKLYSIAVNVITWIYV